MANPWDNDPVVTSAPKGQVFTLPPNPKDVQASANEAERIRLAREAAARAADAEARAQAEAQRKALEWQATHNPDGSPKLNLTQKPTLTAKERADALAGYTSATQLDSIITQLEQQFKAGPGATHGIAGALDYLPSTANQQFDSTGNAARGTVGSALGFTGGQLNTATEANMAVGPYLPQSGDRDSVILDKIQRLKELRDLARQRSVAILGGVPDANGNVTPVSPPANAMTQNLILPGGGATAAPSGATQQQLPIPGPMQDEYNAWLAQNAGSMTPDSYVKFRADLDRKYGFGTDEAQNRAWAEDAIQRLRRGGATLNPTIKGPNAPLSGVDKLRNDAVSNPIGAAAVGGLDAAGFGGVSLLAGDKVDALRDAHPLATTGGQIVGSIGGTGLLSKAGKETIGRVAPTLLEGGARGMFGRGLLTDSIYGTVTGTNQGLDPTAALLSSVVGSGAGQAVGKGVGATVRGLELSPTVQLLRDKGNRLTVGQLIGGPAKGIEDAMTSIPGVGDLVNARRLEGFRDFNRAMFNEAGEPIGATVGNLGEQGVNDLLDPQTGAIPRAYDAATAGVRVPLDPQFQIDMQAVRQAGSRLPSDLSDRFDNALANRVEPIATAGEMTGDTYQQTFRGLKGYRAETTKPGFEQDYRDALTMAMDALSGQMKRGGGVKVVEGLGKADQAYRAAKTIQKAVQAAKNGSGSGEIQIFTPAQANNAVTQAANKYGGPRQSAALIDAAQSVLPSKLPDSGTAKRLLQAGVGGTVLGGAGTYAGTTGDYEGTAKGLALGALLAVGGTRAGQDLIAKALTGRPDAVKSLGQKIAKRSRMFGAGAVPVALNSSR